MEDHAMSSAPPAWLPHPQPIVDHSRPSLVHWPIVVSAVAVSFSLVVCILAWIVTHPGKAPVGQLELERLIVVQTPTPAPPIITPAINRVERPDVLLPHVPPAPKPTPPVPVAGRVMETTPPPLPKARPKGETYGTSVLFLSNPAEAAEVAKNENKLLFVLHVSGNFEESCFT
jgi:hypothetical protein